MMPFWSPAKIQIHDENVFKKEINFIACSIFIL